MSHKHECTLVDPHDGQRCKCSCGATLLGSVVEPRWWMPFGDCALPRDHEGDCIPRKLPAAHSPEKAAVSHRLAALCLYQQAFGFSQEDVSLLREIANAEEKESNRPSYDDLDDAMRPDRAAIREHVSRCRSLASRIEALLPPDPVVVATIAHRGPLPTNYIGGGPQP